MYRIGLPFWKQAARLGIPLNIRVNVMRDDEANVFVATSDDLRGLVCEASTMDELVTEINATIDELLSFHLNNSVAPKPVTDLRLCAA
jgi:predicted RNase H-like HicB family nuclease